MQPLQQFVIKDGQIMEAPPGSAPAATGMSSTPIYLGVAMVFCMMTTGFGGYWYGKFNVLDQMMQNGGRVGMSQSGGSAGGNMSGNGFNLQSAGAEPSKAAKFNRPDNKRTQPANVRNTTAAPAQNRPTESPNAVNAAQEAPRNQPKDGLERDASGKVYEVRSGDTLGQIANRVYGDPSQFPRLFEANPRVLASPDTLVPGQVLRVPD